MGSSVPLFLERQAYLADFGKAAQGFQRFQKGHRLVVGPLGADVDADGPHVLDLLAAAPPADRVEGHGGVLGPRFELVDKRGDVVLAGELFQKGPAVRLELFDGLPQDGQVGLRGLAARYLEVYLGDFALERVDTRPHGFIEIKKPEHGPENGRGEDDEGDVALAQGAKFGKFGRHGLAPNWSVSWSVSMASGRGSSVPSSPSVPASASAPMVRLKV